MDFGRVQDDHVDKNCGLIRFKAVVDLFMVGRSVIFTFLSVLKYWNSRIVIVQLVVVPSKMENV